MCVLDIHGVFLYTDLMKHKPKIKDKILIFWNLEGESDIGKTNGHYPYESEIITITSEDDEYYYDNDSSVEVLKDKFEFYQIKGIPNIWIQLNKYWIKLLQRTFR